MATLERMHLEAALDGPAEPFTGSRPGPFLVLGGVATKVHRDHLARRHNGTQPSDSLCPAERRRDYLHSSLDDLVMLTPPVDVRPLAHLYEAFWSPATMPLRYGTAPVLIDNDGSSDVDGLRDMLARVNRGTWEGKFSSSFRTRKQPLTGAIAAGVVRAWERAFERGAERAKAYWEALPCWEADVVDRDRRGTHQMLLKAARGEVPQLDDDEEDDEDVNEARACRIRCGVAGRQTKVPQSMSEGSRARCRPKSS